MENIRKFLNLKIINDIEYEVRKKYSNNFTIYNSAITKTKIDESLLNSNIFYTVAHIYKDLLENFYSIQYILIHYVRISYDAILDMTPLETTILYKNFIEDKEKQAEAGNANTVNDELTNSFGL